jgi:DNA-binding transcriptional LysR family regulator
VFGRIHAVPVLVAFLSAFRDISVRLMLSDRPLHLLDDQIDAALRIGPLADSALVATRLGEVRRVTCAAPAYLAQRGAPALPANLVHHDCVTFDTTAAGEWLFGHGREAERVHVVPRLSVTTAEAALDASIAGLGVTRVLSYQVADAVRDGRLVRLLAAWEPDPWPVHLVTPGQGSQPKKLRAFVDFAVPRLRRRLAEAAAVFDVA